MAVSGLAEKEAVHMPSAKQAQLKDTKVATKRRKASSVAFIPAFVRSFVLCAMRWVFLFREHATGLHIYIYTRNCTSIHIHTHTRTRHPVDEEGEEEGAVREGQQAEEPRHQVRAHRVGPREVLARDDAPVFLDGLFGGCKCKPRVGQVSGEGECMYDYVSYTHSQKKTSNHTPIHPRTPARHVRTTRRRSGG